MAPLEYERIRNAYARPGGPLKNIKSPVARLKKAKEIAAKVYNHRHPDAPNPWAREAK